MSSSQQDGHPQENPMASNINTSASDAYHNAWALPGITCPPIPHLFELCLKTQSISVHLSAIAAFHERAAPGSIAMLPLVNRFMKGVANLRPTVQPSILPWDLNVVLHQLTQEPFEPLQSR